MKMMDAMPHHKLAELFPLIEGAEFDDLVASIKASGLRDPVIVCDDAVLDGRNRQRACIAAGVDCVYLPLPPDQDPLQFVLDKNLKRRHLNESQRAMVASKLANLGEGRPAEETRPIGLVSQTGAAKKLNVGERSVKRAKKVQDKAAPEVVHAVEQGNLSVTAASEIAELPKEEQRELIAKGKKEVVKKAKAVRAERAASTAPRPTNKPPAPTQEMQLMFDWLHAPTDRRAHFVRSVGLPALYVLAEPDHKAAFVAKVGLRALFDAATPEQQVAFLSEMMADMTAEGEPENVSMPTADSGDGLDMPDFLKRVPA